MCNGQEALRWTTIVKQLLFPKLVRGRKFHLFLVGSALVAAQLQYRHYIHAGGLRCEDPLANISHIRAKHAVFTGEAAGCPWAYGYTPELLLPLPYEDNAFAAVEWAQCDNSGCPRPIYFWYRTGVLSPINIGLLLIAYGLVRFLTDVKEFGAHYSTLWNRRKQDEFANEFGNHPEKNFKDLVESSVGDPVVPNAEQEIGRFVFGPSTWKTHALPIVVSLQCYGVCFGGLIFFGVHYGLMMGYMPVMGAVLVGFVSIGPTIWLASVSSPVSLNQRMRALRSCENPDSKKRKRQVKTLRLPPIVGKLRLPNLNITFPMTSIPGWLIVSQCHCSTLCEIVTKKENVSHCYWRYS
jgi:hypothetical protein